MDSSTATRYALVGLTLALLASIAYAEILQEKHAFTDSSGRVFEIENNAVKITRKLPPTTTGTQKSQNEFNNPKTLFTNLGAEEFALHILDYNDQARESFLSRNAFTLLKQKNKGKLQAKETSNYATFDASIPSDAVYVSTEPGCEAWHAKQESYNRTANLPNQSNYGYVLFTRTAGGGWAGQNNMPAYDNKCTWSTINMKDTCTFKQQKQTQCGQCTQTQCNSYDGWYATQRICFTISSKLLYDKENYYDFTCSQTTGQCYIPENYSNPTNETFIKTCTQACEYGKCMGEPICSQNSDCGTNNWTGNTYCQGNQVYRDYTAYTCNNPGNSTATCSSNKSPTLYQTCTGNQVCSNGTCTENVLPIGNEDYCKGRKCSHGQGDCDTDNECAVGLKCVQDAGGKYGYGSTIDVCETSVQLQPETGWQCKDQKTMAYKQENGAWANIINCNQTCMNGECIDNTPKPTDTDLDGFTDEDEQLAGSNANDYSQTPISVLKEDAWCNQLLSIILLSKEREKAIHNPFIFTAALSENCPLAGIQGFFYGFIGGTTHSVNDLLSLPNLVIGLPHAVYTFLSYLPTIDAISGQVIDFLNNMPPIGQAAQEMWNGFTKERVQDASKISTKFIQDQQDRRIFNQKYVKGYIIGYILTDIGATAATAGASKTLKGTELATKTTNTLNKIAKGAARPVSQLVNKLPKLEELEKTIPGLKTKIIQSKAPAEWWEETAKKGANIIETKFVTKFKYGITWLEEGTTTLGGKARIRARHITGELISEETDRLTTFFPTGHTITIEGKNITLPARMNEDQVYELIKEVIESSATDVKVLDDRYIIRNLNVNKYGIKGLEIQIKKNGFIHSAYPLNGEDIFAWDRKIKDFIHQNW